MRRLAREELLAALRVAGVERGGVVHVQSDLRRIGPVDAPPGREAVLDFYLGAFQEALGPEGTLTVSTLFQDYGRFGTPFHRESSPSRTDTFSEHVRTRPGAVRSPHPITSVTALGARAEELCGGCHYDGFGWDSPWARLHRADALIMTLGLGPLQGGTTFFHYLETLYGVPYKYTKLYTAPVFDRGVEVPGPFTMSVRFLDFLVENTPTRLKPHLVEVGKARVVPVGRGELWCCRAGDVVEEGVACLNRDRWFLLEQRPRFRAGELPLDGPTGPLGYGYDRARGASDAA